MDIINIKNSHFLLGVLIFFLNLIADKLIRIPLGEFFLLFLLLFLILKDKRIIANSRATVTLFLICCFTISCATLDLYHSGSIGHAARTFFRAALMYLPLAIFMLLPQKKIILHYLTGLLAAYILYFIGNIIFTVITNPTSLYHLKHIIPTPVTIILFLTLFYNKLSPPLRYFIIAGLITTLLSLPLIGARGAALACIVGIISYTIFRLSRPVHLPITVFIITSLFIPFITVTAVLIGYNENNPYPIIQTLYDSGLASVSNIERTLALHYTIDIMSEFPLTGVGQGGMSGYWAADYNHYTGITETGASPHNYYMEVAAPFGIPNLLLVLTIWFLIYKEIFRTMLINGRTQAIAAYSCAAIGWIMLYEPVAGITRMEIMILVMFSLYHPSRNTSNR